jgi:hypothetical protein
MWRCVKIEESRIWFVLKLGDEKVDVVEEI